jgi:hypothetical protein
MCLTNKILNNTTCNIIKLEEKMKHYYHGGVCALDFNFTLFDPRNKDRRQIKLKDYCTDHWWWRGNTIVLLRCVVLIYQSQIN